MPSTASPPRCRAGTTRSSRPAEALEATSAGRFEYDALYRLTAAYLDEGRATAEWLAYTYDTVDNLVEKTSDRRRESLMHLGELRYGQEGTGAGPHAVSSISDEAAGGAQTYTYDAAGNMITREGQLNTWDFMGRLSAVESQDGGQPVARFAYGATRDRVVKEDNGQRTHYLRPSPMMVVMMGTSSWAISKILRPMASDWPRSSASMPG